MIDIHHHCLPGVDDGPREWDEAVAMCAMAAAEGIEAIVATPHVLRGRWPTPERADLESRIATLREKTNDTPRLLLGSEYFFAHDMAEVLQQSGGPIVPLAGGRYVLVELAANSVPPLIEQPLYRIQLDGWTPIIAHPERNVILQSHPELLVEWIEHGAKTQVTAGSLTGEFGPEAKRASHEWIRSGLVHFIATDAHNTTRRPPRIASALATLRELAGDAVAEALTVHNPRAVVENRSLDFDPDPMKPEVGGLLTRLRGFFIRKRPTI
ncbi:MAG TPA: CpsB/CapC family capsule biosynthesis tyrosine phosphatase [Thermoanaerobaculia bacterium]|nr:CpsB/CapC family capsule biosynthesis tyrosine phosphatase [Thermoanaerobaculia bacterium]